MADHVEQGNAMFSTSTSNVKEEQCLEDSFIEDKVCISETTITIDNAEVQGPIWHNKVKQYEDSKCLDNIKTELISYEVTEVKNDKVEIKGGIRANDIKIEFDNGLLYCEDCETYYEGYCIKCGMLVNILNKYALPNGDSGARNEIPNDILEIQELFGQTGIYTLRIIPAGVKFGPFIGFSATECPWEMQGEEFVLDRNKCKYLNWMQYVNPTRNICDRNLHVVQSEDDIYYQSTCPIQAGEELLVYFGKDLGNNPNKIVKVDFVTATKDIRMDIFACTFCCLGFSLKSHLAKHKTVCIKDAAGKFSVEELIQCAFCKIHLDPKEYMEHHMAFCCKRNARKCILLTPPAMEATTYLRPIYKCEQCKYRTKYQTDLKQHTSNHHYEVKMYKCGICHRRFKTKEFLRLHVENTHAYVGGKVDHAHSTTDYRNTLEQSSSPGHKKIFKCSRCVFRTNYKPSLRKHMKTKHLKQFDYRCDKCKYTTNEKWNLELHKKTKHFKHFDFKCDICEYRTNIKNNLEGHVKNKHLKKFDFKCDSCEFGTNNKHHLGYHIKTKHLKKFDYKCASCEFGTNMETELKRHIKTKHLKEFNFKCDSCQYRTNKAHHLKQHIKNKHLKQFDHKCDSCEYRTNEKRHLELHIKNKHLKEFDYKCDSCEYRTNGKRHLKLHIKNIHLKIFDYKCDSCEYGTSNKHNLDKHIKNKHSKEFDYKCHSCEHRTSEKRHLEVHIKNKHTKKEFDYKCDL